MPGTGFDDEIARDTWVEREGPVEPQAAAFARLGESFLAGLVQGLVAGGSGAFDPNAIMNRMTIVATLGLRGRLRGRRRWVWRMEIGLRLIRLGAWVMRVGYAEEKEE